jgi:hypothetical protein
VAAAFHGKHSSVNIFGVEDSGRLPIKKGLFPESGTIPNLKRISQWRLSFGWILPKDESWYILIPK